MTARTTADISSPSQRRRSVLSFVVVLAVLVVLWEGYKLVWTSIGIIAPVRPDNVTMPHVWDILLELAEPASRGGAPLIWFLAKGSLITLGEALVGFVVGGAIGFGFGVLFVRSRFAERAFMPYVVASQTVPILALAPMVVIWGRQLDVPSWIVVSTIATYLTFFPVTINTLRGLRSPQATAVELMRSYAATPNDVLWKLRVPSALPYIFTSLKISASASIIGAIIGELPASVGDGLGRAIFQFASRFAVVSPKLYATLLITCLVGIGFVGLVALAERRVLAASQRQPG